MTAAAGCAAVATVTASAPGTASATPSATHAAKPAVTWTACTNARLISAKAECGTVAVPLDYADPNGRMIKIAISRLKGTAKGTKHLGPMLLNPGGPGGSGLTLPLYLNATLPKDVRPAYDLIGFDPRGVGNSEPAMSCDPEYNAGPRPDYVPTTDMSSAPGANETEWLARSERYADACAEKFGWLLPHLTTPDTVRDMDTIRQALGAPKINYYGFSYGTYLGQIFATMFPDKVGRFVFDGNVDPTNVWYDAQLDQDRAFEVAMHEFFGWVAAHDKVYGLGGTADAVSARYSAEEAALRKDPVGTVGPAEWTDVFLPAGYSQDLWPEIAGAFAKWTRGEHKPVVDLWNDAAELGDDNGFAMYVGVQCVDAKWPLDYGTWRTDGFATAAKAPFETWGNVWFNTPCMFWGAPQGVPTVVDGSRAPAPLLVNTTLDGATPFSGALTVRRLFPKSVLVAEVGNTTHANSLSGNACVDNAVFKYLRSGTLPTRKGGNGPDVSCKASPLPSPDPADVAAATARPKTSAALTAAAERLAMVTTWARSRG